MVEEQSRRIEQEITKIVDDLDKSYLRKMQVSIRCILFMVTLVNCNLVWNISEIKKKFS